MPSLFTKIIRGELPCYKVFENEYVLALLTRDAIRLGHTLVVPKVEVDHFSDVPEPYYSEVFQVGKRLARAIQSATTCKRVGMMVVGLEVPHFHLHLVPLFSAGDASFARTQMHTDAENSEMLSKLRGFLE